MRDRQSAEAHGIHQLKNGGIRAYPQSQRENRHGGKAGIQTKLAQSIAQIAHKAFHGPSSSVRRCLAPVVPQNA